MGIKVEGGCTLLQVFDMKTSVAFYRDILGFEFIDVSDSGEEFDWCRLKLNDTQLMLNTQYEGDQRPETPDPDRTSAHKDTGLFYGCRDLDSAYTHLKAQGIDVSPPVVRNYGMRQLGFHDPDGYWICLQWPAE